jgi:16S rRNA (adenine(1408)-N(1))-methyltransferase
VTVDLGTGDGRFVLAHASAHPDRLVVGIDASPEAMREASRRAARLASRGGLPNARFLVSAVDALPAGLDGFADLVTVHFPWGSLRDAAAGDDPTASARIGSLVRPGGSLRLVLSAAERDGIPGICPETVATAYAALGMTLAECRSATLDDAVAVHSSWGKRLLRRPDPGRSAWAFRLDRVAPRPVVGDRIAP